MGINVQTMIFYTVQPTVVRNIINREGKCFNKEKYIEIKDNSTKNFYIEPYRELGKIAQKLLTKPEGAEIPFILFREGEKLFAGEDKRILKLEVPVSEALLFNEADIKKIFQLRLLGTEAEETAFKKHLSSMGINYLDAVNTNFYP